MKTILAALLSLALLLSPAATAAGRSGPEMAADTVTVSPGQAVQVPIRLSGNTGLAGGLLTVSYGQGLTLTRVTQGEALSTLVMTPPGDLSANPFNILWDGTEADSSDGVMACLHFTAPEQPGRYEITLSFGTGGGMVDNQLQNVPVALTQGAVVVEETPVVEVSLTESTGTAAAFSLTYRGEEPLPVWCMAAAYDGAGRMTALRAAPLTLTGAGPASLTLTYGPGGAHRLRVFLLAPDTFQPIQEPWEGAP